MYKVQYKSQNALQTWAHYASYGSEGPALSAAMRILPKFALVRVIDARGNVLFVSAGK